MSGSPKNIQRDGIWCLPKTSAIQPWSTAFLVGAATGLMSGPAAVNPDVGFVQSSHTDGQSLSINELVAIGVYLDPPQDDSTPYRVKASVFLMAENAIESNGVLMLGYGPASPTGTDDVIDEPYYIPFGQKLDELLLVQTLDSSDPNYGRPLAFAVCATSGSTTTNQDILAHISVQNLGTKPPTMINAVS